MRITGCVFKPAYTQFVILTCNQQHATRTIANRTAIVEVHWPCDYGVYLGIAKELFLIRPCRHWLPLLLGLLDSAIHYVTNRLVELGLRIQGSIVVALYSDIHQVLSRGSVFREICRSCSPKHTRESEKSGAASRGTHR